MSERDSENKGGSSAGLAIAVVGGLLLLVALGGAAVVVYRVSVAEAEAPRRAHVRKVVISTADVARQKSPEPGVSATVKLTALGEGGTWYMIDEDICEGDAALTALVRERLARDKAARGSPADYAYVVRLEPVANAGITEKHLQAARAAVEAAGARVCQEPADAGSGKP